MNDQEAKKKSRSSSSLTIPFGLSQSDGLLYEPRQVPLGKDCGCICPACMQPLYSKHCLAEKIAPHFAHAPGTDCAKGYETAIHLAAKQLIDERRHLAFPRLIVMVDVRDALGFQHTPSREIQPAGIRHLDGVILEKSIGDIRPDLIVDARGIGRVLVEIAVTHFVSHEKLKKVRATQTPALEIDVSSLRDANFAELHRVLFDEPKNSRWLFHPDTNATEEALMRTLEKVLSDAKEEAHRNEEIKKEWERKWERDRAVAEEERLEHERAKRHDKHIELKRATAFKNRPEPEKIQILLHRLGVSTLPDAIKLKVRGAGSFGVKNPHVWQTTLFGGLIHGQAFNGHSWVKKDYAVDWLRYRFNVTPEFAESEHIAVWDYLCGLSDLGALVRRKKGYFNIAIASLSALETLIALQANQVSLGHGLVWAQEAAWPSQAVADLLIYSSHDSSRLNNHWHELSTLLSSVREHSPLEICDWYAGHGLDEDDVTRYLVRAGFLVSHASNYAVKVGQAATSP